MRLTTTKKKTPDLFVDFPDIDENKYFLKINGNSYEDTMQDIANKLGQLEDIEEELGIDLVAFFTYLSAEKVFYKDDFNEIKEVIVRSIHKKAITVFIEGFGWGECDFNLYFKDYGKTWALTKEELK